MSRISINSSPGLTLIEVIITVLITMIVLAFVYVTLDGFYNANLRIAGMTTQNTQLKLALHQIESDIFKTNGLLASVPITQTPLGADNAIAPWQWDDPTSLFRAALISRTPVTTGGSTSQDRQLVIDKNSPDACAGNQSLFLTANYIYFIRNNSLYRRIILPSVANACGSIAAFDQRQSCNAAMLNTYATVCQSSDAHLLDNVTNFTIAYYNSIDGHTPLSITPENSESTIPQTKSIVITLETKRSFAGKENKETASIRMNVTRKNS